MNCRKRTKLKGNALANKCTALQMQRMGVYLRRGSEQERAAYRMWNARRSDPNADAARLAWGMPCTVRVRSGHDAAGRPRFCEFDDMVIEFGEFGSAP